MPGCERVPWTGNRSYRADACDRARHVRIRAQLGDLPGVVEHEHLDRIHDHHRRRLTLGRVQRDLDLEHHRGLIRADDHVARNELDRLRQRSGLVPERPDPSWPTCGGSPTGSCQTASAANRSMHACLSLRRYESTYACERPCGLPRDPSLFLELLLGRGDLADSGQSTMVPPAGGHALHHFESSVTTIDCTSVLRLNTTTAASAGFRGKAVECPVEDHREATAEQVAGPVRVEQRLHDLGEVVGRDAIDRRRRRSDRAGRSRSRDRRGCARAAPVPLRGPRRCPSRECARADPWPGAPAPFWMASPRSTPAACSTSMSSRTLPERPGASMRRARNSAGGPRRRRCRPRRRSA